MSISEGRFLITGGASLIGSHLTRALLAAGAAEVVLYDNLSLGTAALLGAFGADGRVRSVRGDVLRLPQLMDAVADVDGIFALAGYLTLPFSENPAVGADVNVMGMINTLEAARLSGPRRVVFASSVAVYGGDIEGVVDESRGFRAGDISAGSGVVRGFEAVGRESRAVVRPAVRRGVLRAAVLDRLRRAATRSRHQRALHPRGDAGGACRPADRRPRLGRRGARLPVRRRRRPRVCAGDGFRRRHRRVQRRLRPIDQRQRHRGHGARGIWVNPASRSTSPTPEPCGRRLTTNCTSPRPVPRRSSAGSRRCRCARGSAACGAGWTPATNRERRAR